jgi:membrane dipeptidase
MPSLDRPLTIDGLLVSNWTPELFSGMRTGGLSAAICTCSIWEGFAVTCENIAAWKRRFVDHADLICQVRTAKDIERAHADGKTGIILGWQNTSALEGNIELLPQFAELGIKCIQLTYNTQNFVGSGCWEKRDGGLSYFGYELIEALHRERILIDLSHVGAKTAQEAIDVSSGGIAYTHVCPRGLKDYARNKTDEELRYIASKGGFAGIAFWPPFMNDDWPIEIASYLRTLEYAINVMGEDRVGIGTDLCLGHPPEWMDWLHRVNGKGRRIVPKLPRRPMPAEFCNVSHYPNLIPEMERAGWKADRIERILGRNWLNFLRETWGG